MTRNTRIALFLLGELVAALRTNDLTLKRWLSGGMQDLGELAVTELLLDWLDPFLTEEEQDRLLGWHLGLNSSPFGDKAVLKIPQMGCLPNKRFIDLYNLGTK